MLKRPSYVKSLPEEFLPTFWSDHELQLLTGTTLAPAVSAKLKSLQREYDLLCMAAAETSWYRSAGNIILLDDWYQVDAMYRSRALDYPEIGHCMVPCVDLANHASGEATGALYEKDASGNAVLLLRDGRSISKGDEVTITYGDDKGACEMLFSYGFLEDDRASASTLFLSLSIPSDDPYSSAKSSIADCAPGFKLTILDDGVFDWTGDFIWLMCVSHEDGLHLEVARTVDGNGEEMQATYDGQEVHGGAAHLRERLQSSDLWNVYQLRAVALLQQRVYDQLQVLFTTQEELEATPHGSATDVRAQPYQQAMQLRRLEFELLEQAYEHFETQVSVREECILVDRPNGPISVRAHANRLQKLELAATEVVQQYLAKMNSEAEAEEDFS